MGDVALGRDRKASVMVIVVHAFLLLSLSRQGSTKIDILRYRYTVHKYKYETFKKRIRVTVTFEVPRHNVRKKFSIVHETIIVAVVSEASNEIITQVRAI
jgi:hypothetical protein